MDCKPSSFVPHHRASACKHLSRSPLDMSRCGHGRCPVGRAEEVAGGETRGTPMEQPEEELLNFETMPGSSNCDHVRCETKKISPSRPLVQLQPCSTSNLIDMERNQQKHHNKWKIIISLIFTV